MSQIPKNNDKNVTPVEVTAERLEEQVTQLREALAKLDAALKEGEALDERIRARQAAEEK